MKVKILPSLTVSPAALKNNQVRKRLCFLVGLSTSKDLPIQFLNESLSDHSAKIFIELNVEQSVVGHVTQVLLKRKSQRYWQLVTEITEKPFLNLLPLIDVGCRGGWID